MPKHWGRDALFADSIAGAGGNQAFASILLYHMLRVANFSWLWECDGEVGPNSSTPNHCTDGNMEASGTSDWTALLGATLSKDTAIVHSGIQSLKVSANAQNAGVRSSALLSVTNPTTFSGAVGDNISGPTNGIMTLYDVSGGFITKDLTNCRAVCSGFSNANNNGTFLVKDSWYNTPNTDRYLTYFNANGVAQAGLAGASMRFDRKYEVSIWAYNDSGVYWNVDVDPGDGSFVTLGTIPDNGGVWTLYHFSFYAVSTGSRYVRVIDPSSSFPSAHDIYLDGILVFRSSFEYAPVNQYGTDGILTNPDKFSTAGSYTCGAQDIGKWLFVWDATNNKNSGYYKVAADLGSGVVQLTMRSASATFTTASSLRWRLVDVDAQSHNDALPTFQVSMGYGIQSPHSSGWQWFSRLSATATTKPVMVWGAPDSTAKFNWSSGTFYAGAPSTQNARAGGYVYNTAAKSQIWQGLYATSSITTRDWFMTDEDGSFFTFIHWASSYTQHACIIAGYTGADSYHPGIQEFAIMAAWADLTNGNMISFGNSDLYFTNNGVAISPRSMSVECAVESLAYGTGTADVETQSNAGPNPWSGREWFHPLVLFRDYYGYNGCPSERNMDIGVYQGRTNLTSLTTIDSNNYLHFINGLIWEWSGESIV